MRFFLAAAALSAACVMVGCSQSPNSQAFVSQQLSAEQNAMSGLLTATQAAFASGKMSAASERIVAGYESDAVSGINAGMTAYLAGNYSLAGTDIAQAEAGMNSLAPQLVGSSGASTHLKLAQASLQALSTAVSSAAKISASTVK